MMQAALHTEPVVHMKQEERWTAWEEGEKEHTVDPVVDHTNAP